MGLTKISGDVIQTPLNVGVVTATGVNVGTAVTIHTGGFQIGSSDIHSTGISVRNVNSTGVVTATSFSGNVTGNITGNVNSTGVSTFATVNITQSNPTNLNVSGVSTFAGITTVTGPTLFAKQLNVSGVITATSFVGSGANLTGIAATTDVRTNSLVVSGVSTFTTLLVGTGVTINSGIITATTVRASSISATGGTTDERPADAIIGTIRYNTIFGYLEYFDGTHWLAINAAGYRGVFGGGNVYPGGPFSAPAVNTIDYLTIAALGNAIDFGDLSNTSARTSAVSSSTRGVFGAAPFTNNILDYITIATTGNALDFGDDIVNPLSGCTSNQTRGLWGGGYIHNVIRYITIASTGDALDFGDLIEPKWATMDGSVASPTRGIFAGGSNYAPVKTNRIDYVTIASTGNSTNFGDLIVNGAGNASCSSSTRGVLGVANDNLDYITIASTGNSVDFGGRGNFNNGGAASNNIRGVFVGGYITNVMQHITIATTGDAVDFGDLTTVNRWTIAGCSNNHGGLQ